jgi:WD40 repeat protein
MTRIFISYSSIERNEALSIQTWLEKNGWMDDVFLDVDPEHGLAGGEAWRSALRDAAGRCEAIIILLSRNWLGSKACWSEFQLAEKYGKPCIPVRIDGELAISSLPQEIINVYQVIDKAAVPLAEFEIRLKRALELAGAGPENFALAPGRRPYPGLKALTEDDAALFFGRDAEVLSALDALRDMRSTGRRRLLCVLGASGAGKSSLVRAGIWPRINRDDRNFLTLPIVRPANAALSGKEGLWLALETACADRRRERHLPVETPRTRAAIRSRVGDDPKTLASIFSDLKVAAMRAAGEARAEPPSVVVVIDQAEELFNVEGGTESDTLLRLLDPVWAVDPNFLAVLSIRSDVYPRLQADERIDQSQVRPFNLPPMGPAGLAQVIKGPADRAELEVDPVLTQTLLRDAKGGDALPLLAFTLERLYDNRLDSKRLRLSDYTGMGGVKGAIEAAAADARTHAEARGMHGSQLDLLLRRTFIPHLARINEAGEYARRVAGIAEFEAECLPLIDVLVAQRLLVMDQRDEARTVEIAHEAILREWPLLAGWLDAERAFLEWREQVGRARTLYDRNQGDLLSGRALLIAQGFLEARRSLVSEQDRKFIDASAAAEAQRVAEAEAAKEARRQAELETARAREDAALAAAAGEKRLAEAARRTSGRLRRLAMLMFVLALGAGGAGYLAYLNGQKAEAALADAKTAAEEATKAKKIAESEKARAENEAKRAESEKSRAETSARTANDARLESESRRLAILAEGSRSRFGDDHAEVLAWLGLPHDPDLKAGKVTDEAATSIYKRAVVHVRTLFDHKGIVFSPAGDLALSIRTDGTAEVWDTTSGNVLRRFEEVNTTPDKGSSVAAFARGGSSVLLLDSEGVLKHWDLGSGKLIGSYRVRSMDSESYGGLPRPFSVSADGSRLFVVLATGEAQIIDLATLRMVGSLKAPRDYFLKTSREDRLYDASAFSPSGRYLMTTAYEYKACIPMLWDVATGAKIAELDVEGGILDVDKAVFYGRNEEAVLISPFNRPFLLSTTKSGQRLRWIAETAVNDPVRFTNDEKHIVGLETDKLFLAPVADGPSRILQTNITGGIGINASGTVAVTASGNDGYVWDIDSGALRYRLLGHTAPISSVILDTKGSIAVTIAGDNTAKLWNVEKGVVIKTIAISADGYPEISLDPSQSFLIIEDTEKTLVDVWRVRADVPKVISTEGRAARAIAFSNDGRLLLVAGEDGKARLISAASGAVLKELASHTAEVVVASFSADGRKMLTAAWDGTAKVWSAANGALIATLKGHTTGVAAAAFSPDGTKIATGSHDATARLWTLDEAGATKPLATLAGHRSSVTRVSFSPDGKRLITASLDGTTGLWDATTGKQIALLAGHDGPVFTAAFSPDGAIIATASADHLAKLWNGETGEPLREFKGHAGAITDLAWSADGKGILTASADKTVRQWNVADGKLVATYEGALDDVRKVAFSPDQKSVIAVSADKTLRIWDVRTGVLIATLSGHEKTLHDVAVSPSGHQAATASADGTVRIWTIYPGTLVDRIAEVTEAHKEGARKPLSADDCAQYRLAETPHASTVCRGEGG